MAKVNDVKKTAVFDLTPFLISLERLPKKVGEMWRSILWTPALNKKLD